MSELVAVFEDECEHLEGKLLCDNNNNKMFVQERLVALIGSSSDPDSNGDINPKPETGSSKLFVSGIAAHRNNDERDCGSKTIVTHQTKLYAN